MPLDYSTIFKANDIRGIYGDSLDEDIAYRIGQMLAVTAQNLNIAVLAVGRDGRLSSPSLSSALINGLVDAGITIMDVGLVPTPALYYAAVTHCNGSGVMLTGSHNPKNYNGMKIMLNGKVLMGNAMIKLRDGALSGDTAIKKSGRQGHTAGSTGRLYRRGKCCKSVIPSVKNRAGRRQRRRRRVRAGIIPYDGL